MIYACVPTARIEADARKSGCAHYGRYVVVKAKMMSRVIWV